MFSWAAARNYITNNISVEKTYGLRPYVSAQGFTFAHNYSEGAYPLVLAAQEVKGAYEGTFKKFAITSNVINNTGGWTGYEGNIVDARPCKINDNVYLGQQRWRLGLTQAVPPVVDRNEYATFESYVGALRALPHCAAWEKRSRASPAAPRFDFAEFDAFLDTDPPLAAALWKARRYVMHVTAPFPGAGPAIDLPVAKDRD